MRTLATALRRPASGKARRSAPPIPPRGDRSNARRVGIHTPRSSTGWVVSTPNTPPLRVVIDARLRDGESGGVQQTLLGLAHGLSQLDGDEQYLFLGIPESCDWLRPHLRGRCSLLPCPSRAVPDATALRRLTRRLADVEWVRRSIERGALGHFARVEVPRSDGTIERAGADVMHFALQGGFWTAVPSIYVPHDLQHAHHLEYFSPLELRWRAAHYGPLAQQARAVVALSRWGKRDLATHLHLAPEKVHVIGWAPAIDAYGRPGAP